MSTQLRVETCPDCQNEMYRAWAVRQTATHNPVPRGWRVDPWSRGLTWRQISRPTRDVTVCDCGPWGE